MEHACREFRNLWLEHALEAVPQSEVAGGDHVLACGACRTWVRAAKGQIGFVGALTKLTAPPELDELVADGLRSGASEPSDIGTLPRVEHGAVERGPEPQATFSEPQAMDILRELSRVAPPAVLERLIEEELRDPAAARARRFAGDLERRSAPARLERRMFRILRGGLARPRRLIGIVAPLATAAAAVLVVWLAFLRGTGMPESERPFLVYRAESTEGLHPIALDMADALVGGGIARLPESTWSVVLRTEEEAR